MSQETSPFKKQSAWDVWQRPLPSLCFLEVILFQLLTCTAGRRFRSAPDAPVSMTPSKPCCVPSFVFPLLEHSVPSMLSTQHAQQKPKADQHSSSMPLPLPF